MKLSRLYLKLFFSFLLVLIVTEILIFGLFVFAPARGFRSQIDELIRAHSLMAKALIEERIRSNPGLPPSENPPLRMLLQRLGQAYGAQVWLLGADGRTLAKSFPQEIPHDPSRIQWRHKKVFEDCQLFHGARRGWNWYAFIPIALWNGERGSLHLLSSKQTGERPEGIFGLGLLVVGLVVALLIIPVSKFITKRVKGLSESALRIAEGDLSHRAVPQGKDEIGELGRTFNRMADKIEKMIQGGKELTANVSHELRSPLARIRVAQELLMEKLENPDKREWERLLDDIREDVEELDKLIGQILDLSKLDLHDSPLNFEQVDPVDLLEGLLERFTAAIDRKGLTLDRDLSFDPPFFGDKEALRTALSNVMDNAVKYTPVKGSLGVKMRSENEWLNVQLTNSFGEMSEEDLVKIFDPFYRKEGSTKTGSGLGLAITRKIVEKHGGQIKAVNSPEGLQIEIILPARPNP